MHVKALLAPMMLAAALIGSACSSNPETDVITHATWLAARCNDKEGKPGIRYEGANIIVTCIFTRPPMPPPPMPVEVR